MRLKTWVAVLTMGLGLVGQVRGEAMLQLFNLTWNQIADKMPELAEAGYTALWLPPPAKANSQFSAGYDCFDPFDLGDKDQKGTIATRYGTKDELLRMVKVAHRFGIRVYFDNIMNHRSYDVPGYDANTPITVYPGLLPEDFHLRLTADGFYRKWDNISDWNNVWQIQNRNFSDLIDLSQENPNANFGLTEGTVAPKLSFIRQPSNPAYYPDLSLPIIAGPWRPFNGTNAVPYVEDTASYIIRAAMWFMNETKCDGLRLDAVKHVPSYFFGAYLPDANDANSLAAGYDGAIQTMYQYVHGYVPANGYNGRAATGNPTWNNRTACFDAEAIRNGALIFGEHLGEPPSFAEYTARGMRLVDAPLVNTLNNILGNPSSGLQGLDQVDYDGYSYLNHYNRIMYAQSHDNGYANHRELQFAYMFAREGITSIYSDGYFQSAYCKECGGDAFPRIANAPYLGEYGDNKMPELVNLHEQLARGGTRPRWSDNDVVAFERYDYREGSGNYNDPTLTTVLFAMNDNYGFPGDINFDDGVAQSDAGMPFSTGCYGGTANSRHVGLVVSFPPGSVLAQLATSAPGAERACSRILVRNATTSYTAAQNSINDPNPVNRLVYVGNQQTIPPGGGAVEFNIPSGGYVLYGYQGPEPSRASLKDAITIRQNGQDAPRLTIQRATGRDGDQSYNPLYPFQRRGSITPFGAVVGSSNVGPLTYAFDVPIITNASPIDIAVRTDASAVNILVKLDGGIDLNSQMSLGPSNTYTAGMLDLRDNKPGYGFDMFLGYEQAFNQIRYGPEKFAATNITNDTVVSLGAETYSYDGSLVVGGGGGLSVKTSTAEWVYHEPTAAVTIAGGPATQRNPLTPGGGQTADIYVKVGYKLQITKMAVYYTTDGTNPEGSFGVPKPGTTTQVVLGAWVANDQANATIDWWKATLPASGGATIKYKVAVYNDAVATPISDGDYTNTAGTVLLSKWYGLQQSVITNFNPATAKVWLHDDLNTNSTLIGLEPGFHVLRARAFLPRTGKSSAFNTFVQTFYYDPATPQGVIAFPAENDTIYSPEYGAVIRTDANATGVDYSITDLNNPGGTPFLPATQVSPYPALTQQYPNYPLEFRFNYTAIPASGDATITVRLKDLATGTFTNRYTTLVRHIHTHAPPVGLTIGFPGHDGDTISLDQNDTYQIAACFSNLVQDINKFTFLIDGSVQPRYAADGTPLYLLQTTDAFCPPASLRYNWGGMSAGPHLITCLYSNVCDSGCDGYVLQASRFVNIRLTGISVNIIQPPAADAQGRSPYTIVLPESCATVPTNTFTIITDTSPTVTNVLISFIPATNAFAGGPAMLDTNFTGNTKRWNFVWTNLVAGTWTIRADGFGGGSNTAYRVVNVDFQQILPTNPNSDDSDNDGISDLIETQVQTNQLNKAEDNWTTSDVHLNFISGKTDPNSPDTDNDLLPDGLELGVGPLPAATNTDVNADSNCDGIKNFIPDADPPLYNTLDNQTAPAGYEGFDPWPFDRNKPRMNQIAGTVTDPNKPDTDSDGLLDGIEDMNKNGRVEIGLTNSSGVVTNVIAHPPTIYNTSVIDRVKVLAKFPNAIWLETDPNNSDTDNDGLVDGSENGSHTGFLKIGLLDRSVGYSSGSATVTGILATPLPSSILYWPNTSRVNRKALIQQYPNAVLLETDPMDAHTDGDPNGLPDGWKVQHGLDPWDDGVIGHTNWHSGALITSTTNGAFGVLCSCCPTNLVAYQNGLDPRLCYTNGLPVGQPGITIGPGEIIGTTGGVTWNEEFQGWTANDLKALDEYDGNGSLKRQRDVFPLNDGFDWSRDLVAFYARDGGPSGSGGDDKYYFRVDMHDLTFGAEQGKASIYVIINVGIPGTGATVLPDNIGGNTDMGWNVAVGIYGQNYGNVYVRHGDGSIEARGYNAPGGLLGAYWRADLDAIEFAISRQALLDAGWSGFTPLNYQVYTTPGPTRFGWHVSITDSIYDDGIAESDNAGYGNTLHYWFTSNNQNPIGLGDYNANNNIGNEIHRPNIAKVAFLLHANQSDLPASIIQGLISNSVTRTTAGADPNWDPGNNPTGYFRALESAKVFGVPLNLHLSGSLIAALQWAKSDTNDPTGSHDGPLFNQRIATQVALGKVSLLSGMFAEHIAPYFTGAVNRAGIQLQDDILRSVYGSNSVSVYSPVYLAERVADGATLADLAANSGHNFTVLDQMVHLWWWGEQLYGFGNGRLTALGDGGYQINRFSGMNAFLISGASDQMYQNFDLGTSIVLRELLMRKAQWGGKNQIVILGDNWETAGGIGGGNHNPDALNLNLRWIANHPWIKVVTLDKFGQGQVDIDNDGTLTVFDYPYIQDRGTANFSNQSKDYVRHASENIYNNWFYGSSQEESFFAKKPPIRPGTNAWFNLGHVLTNGTILASVWNDVKNTTGSLSNLASLVYLNGIFETAFHKEDNANSTRYSTGDYIYPDSTYDSLSPLSFIPNSHITRQAGIVAAAAAWAASSPSTNPVAVAQDVDHDGENEYILSNNRLFAVFERSGGRLIAAFARDPVTGSAYQMIGNLVSTPDSEDELEGNVNLTTDSPPVPVAYRTSGFKDWYALNSVNGNTNQYVNDYFSVAGAAGTTGWTFTSTDSRVIKTITLAPAAAKLEAGYKLANGVTALYIRHGLAPDALGLLYQGQQYLTGPTDAAGRVSLRNNGSASDATVMIDYADNPAQHSNTVYNAAATDKTGSFTSVNMRNQAQTQQIELLGTSPNFSFAVEFNVLSKGPTVDHVGDGIPDAWRKQYFDPAGTGTTTNGLSCATCDPDGDGLNNMQEYLAGTVPTDSTSLLRIVSVTPVSNGYQIVWASVPGKSYQIFSTPNLATTAFTQIPGSGTISAAGTLTSYPDTSNPGARLFYRVRLAQ